MSSLSSRSAAPSSVSERSLVVRPKQDESRVCVCRGDLFGHAAEWMTDNGHACMACRTAAKHTFDAQANKQPLLPSELTFHEGNLT